MLKEAAMPGFRTSGVLYCSKML